MLFGRRNMTEKLRADRDRMAGKLAAEQEAMAGARASADAAALDDAPASLDPAVDRLRRAELRCDAYRAAVAKLDAQIADAERAEIERADRAEREKTSRQINAIADRLEKAAAPFAAALEGGLAALLDGVRVFGEVQMVRLFKSMQTDLLPGFAILAQECRNAADATLAKLRPPMLEPPPPQLVPPPAPPPVERVAVFMTRKCEWTDNNGELRQLQPYRIERLPPAMARRAMDLHAAVSPESPYAVRIRKGCPNSLPYTLGTEAIINLDDPPPPSLVSAPVAQPIFSSHLSDAENYRRNEPVVTMYAQRAEPTPGDPSEFGSSQ